MRILTERLELRPATAALVRAEMAGRQPLAGLLGATVPAGWPPETLADALPVFLDMLASHPEQVGWWNWYALTRLPGPAGPVLVGGGGFKGPPAEGEVEIGYSVLPAHEGRGHATEIVRGLASWAMARPGVERIVAETEWANPASVRVLEKAGFVREGDSAEPNGSRFALARTGGPAR